MWVMFAIVCAWLCDPANATADHQSATCKDDADRAAQLALQQVSGSGLPNLENLHWYSVLQPTLL